MLVCNSAANCSSKASEVEGGESDKSPDVCKSVSSHRLRPREGPIQDIVPEEEVSAQEHCKGPRFTILLPWATAGPTLKPDQY